jgi:hypothetical protein
MAYTPQERLQATPELAGLVGADAKALMAVPPEQDSDGEDCAAKHVGPALQHEQGRTKHPRLTRLGQHVRTADAPSSTRMPPWHHRR